jgi:hypothetical protein
MLSRVSTSRKLLIPILLGAVATIATPIVFSTIIGWIMGAGRNKMPLNFIILLYSVWALLNVLAYLSSLPLYVWLRLPRTSFRLMAHGVTAMLTLIALAGVLSQSGGLNAEGIPGLLLLMFAAAFAAFFFSTLLQFLAQTLITRFSWR